MIKLAYVAHSRHALEAAWVNQQLREISKGGLALVGKLS